MGEQRKAITTLPTPLPELPDGELLPKGFMPYWTAASDEAMAAYGLCYVLQQIQATDRDGSERWNCG